MQEEKINGYENEFRFMAALNKKKIDIKGFNPLFKKKKPNKKKDKIKHE